MHGQRIGYVRVSSFDQNPERQLETACRVRGAVDQDFLFGRPGAYTIADYRLRCNGFRTAARFGTPFAAAPAFECWPIMAFQRSQRAL